MAEVADCVTDNFAHPANLGIQILPFSRWSSTCLQRLRFKFHALNRISTFTGLLSSQSGPFP